ncbi:MAG: ubiquinone/menaquinone biosynthesis methyltransferase [Asticcacaulis sp.]
MQNAARFKPSEDDVFGRIARDYDRYCDYFSFYIQRLWKRAFTQAIVSHKGRHILDLASGTGDIPLRIKRHPNGSDRFIDVTDISSPMLEIAHKKLSHLDGIKVSIVNACEMDHLPDDHYDLITMAFGMKIIDRTQAIKAIRHKLKPGGVFLCIEASQIPFAPLHKAYLTYMRLCLPIMGRLIANGDSSSYDYLLRGIKAFPSASDLARELEAEGFHKVSFKHLSLGIVAIHQAHKPQ